MDAAPMSPDRCSPRGSGGSAQLGVMQNPRSRRSSSVSILDGRPLPPDSTARPKVSWAKGVEYLEHDCSIVIKTVNGKRVSKHPLLQGREPPKPKKCMLFTTGQKVEMYNPRTDKWTIARVRGKVRRTDGWHYALRANHKDVNDHVPDKLLRPVKEYDMAEDKHLIRHMGWGEFKRLFDIPGRGLFRTNKKLKTILEYEDCPFDDDGGDVSDDWENTMSFQRVKVDNPNSVERVRNPRRTRRSRRYSQKASGSSAGKVICLILTLMILFAAVIIALIHFEIIQLNGLGSEAPAPAPPIRARNRRAMLNPLLSALESEINLSS